MTPTFEAAPCGFEEATDATPPQDAVCGWVRVGARRDGTDHRSLRLWVVRLPAVRSTGLPPVIRVLGGPEPMRLAYLGGARTTRLRQRHDVVFFDYRGLGRSEPRLSCRVDAVSGDTTDARLASKLRQYAECHRQLEDAGADLDAIASRENARDIDDIARALGYASYYTHGGSYGSVTTLELIRSRPEGLRAAVIGTPLPPNSPLHDTVGSFASALARIQDHCNRTPSCARRHPDLAGTLAKAMDRIDRTPLHHDGRRLLPSDLFNALWSLMAMDDYVWVPSAIEFAAHGDAGALAPWIGANSVGWDFFLPEPGDAFSIVNATVNCQDIARGRPIADDMRAAAERHPHLARAILPADAFDRLCAAWRPSPVPADARDPVSSDLPVLLFSLHFDPVTPPEDARLAKASLPNAILLEHPGGTHVSRVLDTCLVEMEAAFLADPDAPLDSACTAQWQPAEFVLDAFDAYLDAIEAAP
ncbi:alpha/beta fold hydrolase [Luteimonas saliphila]|uniref:alpha/beta fold hydrolase n=1 Tax=Luteimonas saliphila TaxID=2804919 RepID=UPI00192E2DC5